MATWAEIKQLAGQLKTTQEQASFQHLSERTWVDIVRHLISTDRLKLIYTTDGRSYLTLDELEKEIREEVEVHGGRITIAEIAANLDVEYTIVESKVNEILASSSDASMDDRLIGIPGELLSVKYVGQLAHDIQDRLESRGHASMGELATLFGLPTSFLSTVINQYQGTLFNVHKYGEKYLTDRFVNENKCKIRGYLSAVMRPITLQSLSSKLNIPDSLLPSILNNLLVSGQLNGTLQANRGTYVPCCYSQAEDEYVKAFFSQNGYVEWSYLKRLGILDPATYLRSILPNAIHSPGVSIGPVIIDQVKAILDEVEREGNWADLTHCLPVGLTGKDRLALVAPLSSGNRSIKVLGEGSYIVADAFIQNCEPYFSTLIAEKAELASKEHRSGIVNQHKSDHAEHEFQTKKISQSNKGGFGMGAREIRTKNVKKKYIPGKRRSGANTDGGRDDDSASLNDHVSGESVFEKHVSPNELYELLINELPSDIPEQLVAGIVDLLVSRLESTFNNLVNSVFVPNTDSTRRREAVTKTQEAINNLLFSMQLLDRGISNITQPSLKSDLYKYLMKKHGVCVVDLFCAHLAFDYDIQLPNADSVRIVLATPGAVDSLTPLNVEQRRQLIDSLRRIGSNEALKAASGLQKLVDCLRVAQSAQCTLSEYLDSVTNFNIDQIGFNLPTLSSRSDSNNKRKRDERNKSNELAIQMELQLCEAYERLSADSVALEAPMITLAVACMLTQVVTGWPIVAPGKCVPELVNWLTGIVKNKTSKTGEASAAYQIFINSNVMDNLSELVSLISGSMHNENHELSFEKVKSLTENLIETVKSCRKVLYN